ncbi:prepilin peptidase [Mycetocola zhadangensis]|uniref:prepilin peptidase n=1 Tax=Mycetocola zhadangensis TaxID=1164595 RepID=UPI003A4D60E9
MSHARLPAMATPGWARTLAARLPVAATLIVLGALAIGPRPILFGVAAVAAVTEELVRIDVSEHRLPNRVVLPLYPVILLSVVADGLIGGSSPLLALSSGAGWFAFLLVLCVAGGMGMGDVKLGGALGLCLGALGMVAAASGLVLAFVAGAIGGAVALLLDGTSSAQPRRYRRIPFGPFLLFGFWLAVIGLTFLSADTA